MKRSSGNHFLAQKRRQLNFFCPRCLRHVKGSYGSGISLVFVKGKMDRQTALRLRIISHYRHIHTGYDSLVTASKGRMRIQFNRMALQLIVEDGGFNAIMGGRQEQNTRRGLDPEKRFTT